MKQFSKSALLVLLGVLAVAHGALWASMLRPELFDELVSHQQPSEVQRGSDTVANWYQSNKAPMSLGDKANQQLASVGQWGRYLLAAAGIEISPVEVTIEVTPGMRREEIAELISDKLNWTPAERAVFARLGQQCYGEVAEGRYFPGIYTFRTYANPAEVQALMEAKFRERLATILANPDSNDPIVSSAVVIASLLQREAAGNGDEREIAGIIWNRLYDGMPLQLDATLQYVKGQPGNWWPIPQSEDKFLESPYNTYLNEGLPPTPIANPSLAMIEAALNPEPTDCYFYLHANRQFYCSADYRGHIQNIDQYL